MTGERREAGHAGGATVGLMGVARTAVRSNLAVIAGATLLGLVVGVGYHLIVPRSYTSAATILPPLEEQASPTLIGGLGGILGSEVLGATSKQVALYPVLFKSDTAIHSALQTKWKGRAIGEHILGEDFREDAFPVIQRSGFSDDIYVSVSREDGVTSVSYAHERPEIAHQVLTHLVATVDSLILNRSATGTKLRLDRINRRLSEVSDSLRVAEAQLKRFREENRAISKSPSLVAEEERLVRGVRLQSEIYLELAKQRELSKLERGPSESMLSILDYPRSPRFPDGPSLPVTAVLFAVAFGIVAIGILTIRELGRNEQLEGLPLTGADA